MRRIYIAADGGGTKLELGAVAENGEMIKTVRVDGGVNKKTADEKTMKTLTRRGNPVSVF